MAIVTYSFYSNTYKGEPIAETDFPRAEAAAERAIIHITHGRAANYAALPAFQQEAVQSAICAQIEYYASVGTEVSINGDTASGWTVGKVRVDGGAGSGAGNKAATMIGAGAISALELTGLLNPQVDTFGDPPLLPYIWG